jgi:L-aminopeptidase/D-esterase-like protein
VALLPRGTVASGEVRGGAPASRELALLDPDRTVVHVDAVVLTGGSAFGLAAADGVVRWCEEQGRGVETPAGPVPIVPTMGLYDLAVGDPSVRPGAVHGHLAASNAHGGPVEVGAVGAGTGATVGKWLGSGGAAGGLVSAALHAGSLVVAALIAVNAIGEVDRDGSGAAAAAATLGAGRAPAHVFGNTTIGLVATNATLDKGACRLVAESGHDGLARALAPSHSRYDGDALVAAATGEVEADVDLVRVLTTAVVEQAIRSLPR